MASGKVMKLLVKSISVSTIYFLLAIVCGPISSLAASMYLTRIRGSGNPLPSVNFGVLSIVLIGFLVNILASYLIDLHWIRTALEIISEYRIIPTGASQAFSSGSAIGAKLFVLELTGIGSLAIIIILAVRRPGAWRHGFQRGVALHQKTVDRKRSFTLLLAIIASGTLLFVGYFLGPEWGRYANNIALLSPVIPFLLAVSVSVITTLNQRN